MTPAQKLAEIKRRKRRPVNGATANGRSVWVCQLRAKREEIDLPLSAVAVEVGISHQGLSVIERGGDPMLSTATKLAAFFGCTVAELWPQLNTAADGG